jgi:CDP-diacylglycerol--glycerol-3-phosphate 3-phosphatidyltransferase
MLDSWADVAVYAAVAVSMLLLWPDLVREEGIAFGAVVASFVVPALVGLLRFRRFTSYHTRLVKVAVAASAVGLFLLLLDLAAWPFRVAAVLATLAALEEIAITLVLDEERSNVGSLLHVLRARRRRDDARG